MNERDLTACPALPSLPKAHPAAAVCHRPLTPSDRRLRHLRAARASVCTGEASPRTDRAYYRQATTPSSIYDL